MIVALQGLLYAGLWNNRQTMRDMTWAAHLENPTAMAVSPIIATSFPFVREFGGVWVDQTHSQWVAFFSHSMLAREGLAPEVREAMARHHEEDLKRLLDSVRRNSPDILLVNTAPRDAWLIAELEAIDPSFLDNYRIIAEEGIMRVMARHDPPVAGIQRN